MKRAALHRSSVLPDTWLEKTQRVPVRTGTITPGASGQGHKGGNCALNLCPPRLAYTELLGDHSERAPPGPIPNPEVKPLSADDSAAACRAKVGNRQAPYDKSPRTTESLGFFLPRGKAG